MLTQRCSGHITLGLCRPFGAGITLQQNLFNEKWSLTSEEKNCQKKNSGIPDPDFWTFPDLLYTNSGFLDNFSQYDILIESSQIILGIYLRI